MNSRKYLGVLTFLENLKISLNNKVERMEEISMSDVEKMWALKGANGETINMDLSWVASQASIDEIEQQLGTQTALMVQELRAVKDEVALTNEGINKVVKLLKEQYQIYEPMEMAPEGEADKWEYTLDTVNNAITLSNYKSTNTDINVVIYGNYIIDGIKYKTKLKDSFKCANTNLVTIQFSDEIDTTGLTSLDLAFADSTNLTTINFGKSFNTSNVTTMVSMFKNCSKLVNVDIYKLNTSNVTNTMEMFRNCLALESIDLTRFDFSKVTLANGMFYKIAAETINLNGAEFASLTNGYRMFAEVAGNELNLSGLSLPSLTKATSMFEYASVKSVKFAGVIMPNVTEADKLFYSSTVLNIDLTGFDTSKVTTMASMFYDSKFTSIVIPIDTTKVRNMISMFKNCTAFTGTLDLTSFTTVAAVSKTSIFNYCKASVIKVDKDKWKLPITSTDLTGAGCSALTYVDAA